MVKNHDIEFVKKAFQFKFGSLKHGAICLGISPTALSQKIKRLDFKTAEYKILSNYGINVNFKTGLHQWVIMR